MALYLNNKKDHIAPYYVCEAIKSLSTSFVKVAKDVLLVMEGDRLFHSLIASGKNENLKASV